ncbi:MAG: MarR family transcriptional regulator [Gemmatimonadota bacterium]
MTSPRRSIPAAQRAALSAFVKLNRATNALRARLVPPLGRDHDLTESQLGVLEALLHLGAMPQRQLSDKLLVSGSNLTTVIDNLERRGAVRRGADPADRRINRIALTDKGRGLIERAFPEHAARITSLMGALTRDELTSLGRLCRKLGLATTSGAAEQRGPARRTP